MLYLLLTLIILFIILVNPRNNTVIKSISFGVLFGIIAYNFVPQSNYDLARHHAFIDGFIRNKSIDNLILQINSQDYELLPVIYSYLIAILNNVNLAQFLIVSLGYGIMYYLVSDYSNDIKLKRIYYLPVLAFAIFGFYVLYFISGLYFYIGVILFALAFYLDYQKKIKKRIIVYLLYAMTLFIHDALFFPIGLLVLYKLFRNRINLFSIIIISTLTYFSYSILQYLSIHYFTEVLTRFVKLYEAYLQNGAYMKRLYSGNIFIVEFSKMITVLIFTTKLYIKDRENKVYHFIFLMSLSTLFMLSKSIVMIRFCMLIQLLGIIPIVDYFGKAENNKKKPILLVLFSMLCSYYFIFFIHTIIHETFIF